MNINKFTQKSLQAVQDCEKMAYDYGHQELVPEHLLYSLLTTEDSLIAKLFEKMEISPEVFLAQLNGLLNKRPKVSGGQVYAYTFTCIFILYDFLHHLKKIREFRLSIDGVIDITEVCDGEIYVTASYQKMRRIILSRREDITFLI